MSGENYESIIKSYLNKAFARGLDVLEKSIPAELTDDRLVFKAFGKNCCVNKNEITLDGIKENGAKGVLISIYLCHVPDTPVVFSKPWKAFRDLPNTMPYWGAFRTNAEEPLIPFVERVYNLREKIYKHFGGRFENNTPGDFSFVVFPLPKVPLLYIFYLPDEEFPAEVKCLFPSQEPFMPVDALADVAEHTSRLMVELVLRGDVDGE